MTIEKTMAWKASDGQLFDSEPAAKEHEFTLALAAWWLNAKGDSGVTWPDCIFDRIVADRTKLLPIFKLLNGGPTVGEAAVSAPKAEPPESVPARANGGYARAAVLSPEERSQIASDAANKRWGNTPGRSES